ncbi:MULTISPECIES: helix-turn-helix transcriptional regulator [Halomonadaceae]|uniref:helix-turn-helix domain-containing protein n=1 Tax=Halomonadaceae TaxID=28256 RepID=UPI00159BD78B|nr:MULTISPECIES: helix-turn-helix transcriptional regulator [Halomonas]MCG7575809.1 helix-turn-helix domain-containing protein [Halomonas sp. MMH1-48]MCG7589775.1 helix-turn-helix domain-containing protein [Halomonas sp. McD50-5]MCG7602871.1 helix-turn-helix domain-containing protein [Halomonas sp. MM17-34]MCG7612090.1 helix-turn-helix domain-containing protein [Halomonas sp. MM17-29]MCG7616176.1 helix-turn-helix domain-containing protein [Halomonas sp. McD50-4]MCG7618971.1 helix-turn-helix d
MNKTEQKRLASNIGRAIAKQRIRSQLTQEEVAERLGVGNEAVSRIERGRVIPNIIRLLELAEIFNCEAAELLGQASIHVDDQTHRIKALLAPLKQRDRELMLELVESLAIRFQQDESTEK